MSRALFHLKIVIAVIAAPLITSIFLLLIPSDPPDNQLIEQLSKYIRGHDKIKHECPTISNILFESASEREHGTLYTYLLECSTRYINVSVFVKREQDLFISKISLGGVHEIQSIDPEFITDN